MRWDDRGSAKRTLAAAAAAVLLAPAPALAAHPLLTDDAGTLGQGVHQLELSSELARDRSASGGAAVREDAGEGAVTVGIGVVDRLDVSVGVVTTWSRVATEGGRVEMVQGLGDTGVELKWRALEAGSFALAVKPGVTLPTGDASRGLGTGRPCLALTLVASQAVGMAALHANAAYLHDAYARAADRAAARADRWRLSAAATAEVARGLQLVGDVGAETNPDRASSTWPAYALGGVVYGAHPDLDLDLGVKVGLTEPEPDLAGRFGVTWRF